MLFVWLFVSGILFLVGFITMCMMILEGNTSYLTTGERMALRISTIGMMTAPLWPLWAPVALFYALIRAGRWIVAGVAKHWSK